MLCKKIFSKVHLLTGIFFFLLFFFFLYSKNIVSSRESRLPSSSLCYLKKEFKVQKPLLCNSTFSWKKNQNIFYGWKTKSSEWFMASLDLISRKIWKNSWKSTLWNPIADRKEYNLSSLSVEWIGSISAEDLWSYYNKSSSRGQECSCSSI